jgi:hypothetical protein
VNSADTSPFPSTFDANTVTESAVEGEQREDEISNSWLHTPLAHNEVGMVTELHCSPEVELV